MFGRVPAYTDISHFRSPYENAYIAGYGQDAPAPPPPPNGAPPVPANGNGMGKAYITTDSETGYRTVNKSVQPMLMATLAKYGTTFIGGQFNNVLIYPFTPEQLQAAQTSPEMKKIIDAYNAKAWIEREVAKGNVVFGLSGTLVGVLTGQQLPEGSNMLGTYPAGSPEAKEAAKNPAGVVWAGSPEGKGVMMAGIHPAIIAIAAAAAVGGVYLIATRKKGRGRAPAASF